jgi:D-sedoheptulose 7-phosphate isomerase
MTHAELIERLVAESIRVKTEFFERNIARIAEAAQAIAQALMQRKKVLLFGNGGSAADAQHFAFHGYVRSHGAGKRLRIPRSFFSTD